MLSTSTRAINLMVIDDDIDITNLFGAIAQDMNLPVRCLNDLEPLNAEFTEFDANVIFLDLQMPGYDGVEVLQLLADMRCKANIYLISSMDKNTRETALQIGADHGLKMAGTLAKPFAIEEIQQVLLREQDTGIHFTSQEFEKALGPGGFLFRYQPSMSIQGNEHSLISELEVIPCWVEKFLTSYPDEYLSKINSKGLSSSYFQAVLDKSLEMYQHWYANSVRAGLSINIDAGVVADQSLPNYIGEAARKWQVQPSMLNFVLSDQAVFNHSAATRNLVARLKIKGFNISVELSSEDVTKLDSVLQLPINGVKLSSSVTKGFKRSMEAEFNVSTLISTCNKLNLTVLAAGIDSLEFYEFIRNNACALGQGQHFGNVLDADRVEKSCTEIAPPTQSTGLSKAR